MDLGPTIGRPSTKDIGVTPVIVTSNGHANVGGGPATEGSPQEAGAVGASGRSTRFSQ